MIIRIRSSIIITIIITMFIIIKNKNRYYYGLKEVSGTSLGCSGEGFGV